MKLITFFLFQIFGLFLKLIEIKSDEYSRCYQQDFCLRNLNKKYLNQNYYVDKENINVSPNDKNKISFILKSKSQNNNDLIMKVQILKMGVYRIKIDDILTKDATNEESRKRFKLHKKDEIFNMRAMRKKSNFKVSRSERNYIIYSFDKVPKNLYFIEIDHNKKLKYELKIIFDPFNIIYSIDNKEIISINSDEFLHFEEFRKYNEQENESNSSVRLDFTYQNANDLYGLPERASEINLTDSEGEDLYRLYNIDKFIYFRDKARGLYGSIPFILGNSYENKVFSGIIWNNPSETYVKISTENDETGGKINKKVVWISESGRIDISLFGDYNINNFYFKMHKYIGFASLPPASALGYHQSRWNYKGTTDIINVDKLFDYYDIPYDSIWLDIEHTEDKKYMTWNRQFEDIEDALDILDEKGRNLVVIIDPHIKKDTSYFIYKVAKEKNLLIKIKFPDNILSEFIGKCWCEEATYIDFFNPLAREYWKNLIINEKSYFLEAKNIFIWNDMNEPSVFKQKDLTLPKMAKFTYFNQTYSHREAHNLYGYFMHKTSFDALKEKYKKRPFVLTRSFYLGSHKYGATWTGDMSTKWEDLELSIPMILSNSLSGFSFIGSDVGGFYQEGNEDLYSRWYQLGVFYPFFRAHSHIETYRREPWLYDDKTLRIVRDSIKMRYILLPYIYLTFYQYHQSGFPIIRPLFFKYANDNAVRMMNKQFFFGDHMLIRPVLTENESYYNKIELYLPEDERWYNYYTYQEITEKGLIKEYKINSEEIGIFIKGGSIIPVKYRLRRSSKLLRFEPITLLIALNSEESAQGLIYFDDEESNDFDETEKIYMKKIHFQKNELFIAHIHDNFKISNKIERIIIMGIKDKILQVDYTNFSDVKEDPVEFKQQDNITYLNRIQISMDYLWKIKFKYQEK